MAVTLQVLCFYPVIAQQFNMSPDPVDTRMSIGLKVKKPLYKNSEYGDNPSSLSGVYKLYGYFPLKKNWQINAEVPLVVSSIEEYNETGLANLYVEMQKAFNTAKTTWFSLGVYIPTVNVDKYFRQSICMISDPYSFIQFMKGVSIRSTFGYSLTEKPGPIFGINIGPDLFIPTTEDWDTEVMMHYGIKGGYHFSSLAALAELSGFLMVTEEGSLADRWINQMNLGLQMSRGTFRPGIFYSLYLDKDIREMINGVLGLNLEVAIK